MLPFNKYPISGTGFPIRSLDPRSSEEKFESVRLAAIDLKDQKYEDALKVLLPLARRDFAFTRETVNEIVIKAQQWIENGEYPKALPILRLCAEQKHAHAEYLLSAAYHFGIGVEKSEEKVREHCYEAASHGSPSAALVKASICAGGRIYFSGLNWTHHPIKTKPTPAAPLPSQDKQTLSINEQVRATTDKERDNSSYVATVPPSSNPFRRSGNSIAEDTSWANSLTSKSVSKTPAIDNTQQLHRPLKESSKPSEHTIETQLYAHLASVAQFDDPISLDSSSTTESESNLLDDLLNSFTDWIDISKGSKTKPETITINEIADEEPIAPAVQVTKPKNTSSFGWLDTFTDRLWK